MSLDTWDAAAGVEVEIAELVALWRQAVADGATGLTVSGGEPTAQPQALRELLTEVDRTRREAPQECDILVYTGYELSELDPAQLAAIELADVVVTGRYEAAAGTHLIWRGSANQRLELRTELGHRLYRPFLDHAPAEPPMQVEIDEDGVRLIGVPQPGTLRRLDRQLRGQGLRAVEVTWRPSGDSGPA